MTIEALDDDVNVNIRRTGTALSGEFQIKLNDDDWTDVKWENIGSGKDYNLINAAAPSKSSMSKGDKLRFRNIDRWSSNTSVQSQLKITGADAKVYGKLVYSLTPEFAASTQMYKLAAFFQGSTGLKDASELDLDGIALANNCYFNMFQGCTSLTAAPEIPATKLENFCYNGMFRGCTSLVNAPKLPATTLARYCYQSMFNNCTSLVNAPKLPATALTDGCYYSMFNNCTSLTFAPALPATTLASDCYYNMFNNCTSLVNVPKLPATALADGCYAFMFFGCTKILELHYPASIESNSTFTSMSGSPKFGATIDDRKIFYDL